MMFLKAIISSSSCLVQLKFKAQLVILAIATNQVEQWQMQRVHQIAKMNSI
jgi:hypothetical protein